MLEQLDEFWFISTLDVFVRRTVHPDLEAREHNVILILDELWHLVDIDSLHHELGVLWDEALILGCNAYARRELG